LGGRLVNNNPLVLVGMYPAGFIAGILAIGAAQPLVTRVLPALASCLSLRAWLRTSSVSFKIGLRWRTITLKENIALTLSGAMTFFSALSTCSTYQPDRQVEENGILT